MKVIILLFAIVAFPSAWPITPQKPRFLNHLHAPPPPPLTNRLAVSPTWHTIQMQQDNFNSSNCNVWDMRYIENNQFFQPGGPIFIMLGAEWTIALGFVQGGLMFDMARENGGAMYYTEHRYYGKSFPVSNLTTKNLKYLSTEQALEDVAVFIRKLKSNSKFVNSKIIVCGGSYGGNLAIWMRATYPSLVHAAWSSSAPVLAKVDFFEYSEVVGQALNNCSHIIHDALQEIQRMLQTPEGRTKVSTDFNLCKPLEENDFAGTTYFFETIFGSFAGDVQYAKTETLAKICHQLLDPLYQTPYDSLVKYFQTKDDEECNGGYSNAIHWYRVTDLTHGNERQWLYQTCTEYGFFQTTNSPNQPFQGVPAEMYHMWCKEVFGPSFTPELGYAGATAKNKRYGGLHPNISRVISTHGIYTYDPWHALGLTHDVGCNAPVIIITDESHCADMGSISQNMFSNNQPNISEVLTKLIKDKFVDNVTISLSDIYF